MQRYRRRQSVWPGGTGIHFSLIGYTQELPLILTHSRVFDAASYTSSRHFISQQRADSLMNCSFLPSLPSAKNRGCGRFIARSVFQF